MTSAVQPPPAAAPARARLAPCPDCGREVSTAAPVCIHCGRPQARRPMAGIVAALLLGVPVMAAAAGLQVADRYNPDGILALPGIARGVHLLGSLVLVVGALMSLGGNRRGSVVVRAVSRLMIPAVLVLLMVWWRLLAAQGMADGATREPNHAPMIFTLAILGTAPWWLYLFLFRKSRHP